MAPPRQRWFWALIGSFGFLLLGGVTVTTCLFMQAPRLAETAESETEERVLSVLPSIPAQTGPDVIGDRLPADTRWVVEAQGLRSLALEFSGRSSSLGDIQLPSSWRAEAEEARRALPFDTSDPLAWIRSGYDLTKPWGLAWSRDDEQDPGAWVILLPIRSESSARETTLAWLQSWDIGDRRVAWTWDSSYHIVVIEESASRAPEDRIKVLAAATRETPLSAERESQTLIMGLGGQWTARLRCMGEGASELKRLWGQAWPLGLGGPGTGLGFALRVQPERQRLRMALVGKDLAAIRVNQEMTTDPLEHKEIAASELPALLALHSNWRESLRLAGAEVNAPIESARVAAELGPWGLVVDLRSSKSLAEWEPLIRWWTSLLN
jgi:hypothetical protein